MNKIEYAKIKFLNGVQVSSAFERDLRTIKSLSDESLQQIFEYTITAYINDSPLTEEEITTFSKSVDMHPGILQRAMNFLIYIFKNAVHNKESIEDLEQDLIELTLSEQKEIFINNYVAYQSELLKKEQEKIYTYLPQLRNAEWKIVRNLAVSAGKLPNDISVIINISYFTSSSKSKKIEFETSITNLKAVMAGLNQCIEEAEKCQKVTTI